MNRWYEIVDDLYRPDRWHLGSVSDDSGNELEFWYFTMGTIYNGPMPVRFKIVTPGSPLGFTISTLEVPIVNYAVAELINGIAADDVQLIPTVVEGMVDKYFILNVLQLRRCVDENRTKEFTINTDSDIKPLGEYRYLRGLRVLPGSLFNCHLTRAWGWSISMICSEVLKTALEAADITGIKFRDVT